MKDLRARTSFGNNASWAALALATLFAQPAFSQTTPSAGTQEANAPGAGDEVIADDAEEIIVVGTRASQQSAIGRKRNARTATDSIVADDIGSFPDRNINEAISRVPGVALNRNEFGEGGNISIRGNSADLVRVELDGMGVQNAEASGGTGRGADMRELPAELVKSIDVVKGSTADMTEGSIGGGVLIKTRTGLDFKKPYVSVRAGAQQNSLSQDWRPDFNAVLSNKFFGDRLGVIVSGTYARVQNNASHYEQTVSNTSNFMRSYDFDNSPEKTFQLNPDTIGTDAADVAFANGIAPDGTTLTPRELVTLAAGAQSKAQCFEIFPNRGAGANSAQQIQRIREQQTCLNQWNDAMPSLMRHINNMDQEKRYSFDARLDYKLTDNLTVYAKGMVANRTVNNQLRYRTPVSLPAWDRINTPGSFVDSTGTYVRTRSVSPNAPAGYYLWDPQFAVNAVTTGSGNSAVTNPTFGNVLNVVPGSVEVDANHNVTKMTLTNNTVSFDQISNEIDSKSKYGMVGAEWKTDRLLVEAFGGITKTSSSRYDYRTTRNSLYGDATLVVQDNGLFDVELPAGYDESDLSTYVRVRSPVCVAGANQNPATCVGQAVVNPSATNPAGSPQYLVSQMPLVSNNFSLQYSPRAGEQMEKQAKLDVTYETEDLIPFITRVKVGGMYRNNTIDWWSGGGRTVSAAKGTFGQPGYVPAVTTPTSTIRSTIRACQPTPGSSAPGGLSCNYGWNPSADPANPRNGVHTFTPQELLALWESALIPQEAGYFRDLPNRGNLPGTWPQFDVGKIFSATGAAPFLNFDCLKSCVGSDGNVYDQPFNSADETIKNVYGLFEFEQDLPLGLVFNGNVGVRGVFTDVKGSGLQRIDVIQPGPSFNPADPANPNGLLTQQFNFPVAVEKSTQDWLPSGNFNFWAFNEKVVLRLYGAKTVARPAVGNLIPGGTCTVSQVLIESAGDDTFGCTGRVGNPGLKPFTAWSYNAALEWYPNVDTLFSVAYGKLDVEIGNPEAVTLTTRPFEGSTETDPVTGTPLSDLTFSVPTWQNGPGYKRDIWEFSAKHAFSYLPSFLKYTGFDANASILSSSVAVGGIRDPNTGDVMKPAGESRYYLNGSLWYDDGKLNLRLAAQKRSETFQCISPCGGNQIDFNYPGAGYNNVGITYGYNPGVPKFNDSTLYVDAKVSYNINRNIQVYVEGRNVTRESQLEGTGPYENFENGASKIMRLRYGGRRILTGIRVQFGG